MRVIYISCLIVMTFAISSCSKKAFTTYMRSKVESNNLDIRKVQYYNSSRIVLERVVDDPEEVKVLEGHISLKNGRYIERRIINWRTKGACLKISGNQITMAFDESNDEILVFESHAPDSPYFTLKPAYQKDQKSYVKYGKNDFYIKIGKKARLLVVKNAMFKQDIEKKVAKGRAVN